MSTPKVFGSWHSTCTQAVFTVVHERQGKVDLVNVDLSKGDQKKPEHMARQPFGKIPALEDGALKIYESRAIAKYFNAKFKGGNSLVPATLEAQAEHDQWLSLEQGTANPQITTICLQRFWGPNFYGLKTDENKCRDAADNLNKFFDVLEKHLSNGNKTYIMGSQYCLVDVFLTPYLNIFMQQQEASIVNSRPHCKKYVEALFARPSWKATIANAK